MTPNDRLTDILKTLRRAAHDLDSLGREDWQKMDGSGEDLVAFAEVVAAVANQVPHSGAAGTSMGRLNADQIDLLRHIAQAITDLDEVSPEPPARARPRRAVGK